MTVLTWSDDRVEQLKKLWEAGLSASQIAAELGNARGNTALAHAFEVELESDPIAHDNVVPMSQRLSLLELSEATCHWPVGDPSSPDFFFCGGKALGGLPYCAHHSRVAYQPAADRRRQPPKPAR